MFVIELLYLSDYTKVLKVYTSLLTNFSYKLQD